MRSDRCARFSNRATFQTQAPLPASVRNPLLCLSSSETVDTSAEARQNLPAICRHRQKDVSGSTCRSLKCQRESEFSVRPYGNCHTERVLFNEWKKRLLPREISASSAFGCEAWERCYRAGVDASDWRRNLQDFSVSWLA